jgi:7-cyano-7-deazaguanine synthase in queuosine biosynthesis
VLDQAHEYDIQNVHETLAKYMDPIGLDPFCDALLQVALSLDRFCRQARRMPLLRIIENAGIPSPGHLNGWSLADALWLAVSQKTPTLSFYPLGEIAERSFKRTVIRLGFIENERQVSEPDVELKSIQRNIRQNLARLQAEGVQALFLADFIYEMCRDVQRRMKDGTKNDPCYCYDFTDEDKARSLAAEQDSKAGLLEACREAALEYLPSLMESVAAKDPKTIRAKLAETYRSVTGKIPGKKKNRASRKPALNVIVGSKSKSELERTFTLDRQLMRFLLHTERANIAFDYAQIEALFPKKRHMHSLSKDLLDIAVVVYFADQMIRRDATLRRSLDISIPVRHLALWNEVESVLSETVSFLGRDEVHFHFSKKKAKARAIKFTGSRSQGCVSLFSGGLDSAAGAVWMMSNGLKPVFVSHYSNSFTSALQTNLLAELESRHDEPLTRVGVFVGKTHKRHVSYRLGSARKSPMTQFLRSFLFLSIASVIAIESKINKVYIFENGPVALNPMFSEGRVNTRTAHPRFLANFQNLIEALFGLKLEIENPFLYDTKGEVAALLAQPELRGIVKETNSCWNWSRVPLWGKKSGYAGPKTRHDGYCLPCVVRRASLTSASLAPSDVPYLRNVYKEFSDLSLPDQVLIADYLRFCKEIETQKDVELLLQHPDFSVFAGGVDAKELVAMYRRHAREMIKSFQKQGSPRTKERILP